MRNSADLEIDVPLLRRRGHFYIVEGGLTPFPPYLYLGTGRTCEAQTEACMALPGPAKGLAVATVTYINYPSRRKPSFRRAPGCGLRFCPPRGFSERAYERCMMLTEFAIDIPCPHELAG